MPIPTAINVTYSLGATSSPRWRTQEAITPSPRFTRAADARGYSPRMNTRIATLNANADARGNPPRMNTRSAASGVVADACGNSPQMITCGLIGPAVITPYRARCPRFTRVRITRVSPPGRRVRPDRQNRTGISGITGRAEGSMSRLAPIGQDLELPSASGRLRTTRLLSMRPFSVPASMKTPAPGIGQIWGLASVRRAARVFYPTLVLSIPAAPLMAFGTSHTRPPPCLRPSAFGGRL